MVSKIVYVSNRKVALVRRHEKKLLAIYGNKRRLVPLVLLRNSRGLCEPLALGFPISRFYTRFTYFYMSLAQQKDKKGETDTSLIARSASNVVQVRSGAWIVRAPTSIRRDFYISPKLWGHLYALRGLVVSVEKVRVFRQTFRDLLFCLSLTRG